MSDNFAPASEPLRPEEIATSSHRRNKPTFTIKCLYVDHNNQTQVKSFSLAATNIGIEQLEGIAFSPHGDAVTVSGSIVEDGFITAYVRRKDNVVEGIDSDDSVVFLLPEVEQIELYKNDYHMFTCSNFSVEIL